MQCGLLLVLTASPLACTAPAAAQDNALSRDAQKTETFTLSVGGTPILDGRILRGRLTEKTEAKVVLEAAEVELKLKTDQWIPALIGPPSDKVLPLTSGQPLSTQSDSVYLLDPDAAVRFQADSHRIDPQSIRLSGEHCSVEVLPEYYRRHFNQHFRRFNKQQFPNAPVGWLSWYCYFFDFDEEKARRIADFAEKHFKPFGFQYVQLENWQQNSDKMPPSEFYQINLTPDARKFPHGLRAVADMLHAKGLKAGIYLVPFGTGEREFFEQHRDMFLIDKQGEPLSNWCGRYLLDPTHPKAREHMRQMVRTMTRDWGFDYLKIDGLELGGTYSANFFEKPEVRLLMHQPNDDAFRSIVELLSQSMDKGTFFLACAAKSDETSRCPGLVQGARIGGDVFNEGENPSWRGVIHTARITTNACHLNNIAWYNDPDVLSIREPLPLENARFLSTIVGLTGQLLFLGDILYELPPERVAMLQKLMPVCDIYPGHLLRNKQLQPVWNLSIRRPFEQWNVVALFNWEEKKAVEIRLSAEELDLEPGKEYLLYDFWNNRCVGTLAGERQFKLPAQTMLLLGVRRKLDRPQFLSIDRHITQGGVCIKDMRYDADTQMLSSVMDLPEGHSFSATLYVPKPYKIESVEGNAEQAGQSGELVTLRVRNGPWKARFKKDKP